mgnify:CR=1 FL=1
MPDTFFSPAFTIIVSCTTILSVSVTLIFLILYVRLKNLGYPSLKFVYKSITLLILVQLSLLAQIHSSTESVTFPQIKTKTTDSTVIFVKNLFPSDKEVKFSTSASVYSVNISSAIIPVGDSQRVAIYFTPASNIVYNGVVIAVTSDSLSAVVVNLTGSGKFQDTYDATTFNKFDTELRSALNALVINHTSLGYDTGRDRMFENIDKQPGDTIECVYTGRKVKAATRTSAQSQGFNTEHTWPQGFFNQSEPMRSDIHHLFPTDDDANNRRSNYAFGIVTTGITWQVGGSKLGKNSIGQTVYEPRDAHKGTAARSVLYFITRYPNNYGSYLSTIQENVLRQWNTDFPPLQKELNRNTGVATYQKKRNPYIDHSEFIDRIYSFSTTNVRPVSPVFSNYPSALNYDTTAAADSSIQFIYVVNSGTGTLQINSVMTGTNAFTPAFTAPTISAGTTQKIAVTFKPNQDGVYSDSLTIITSAGTSILPLSGIAATPLSVDNDGVMEKDFVIMQNYPNPFNAETNFTFSVRQTSNVRITIYDVLGKEVVEVVDKAFSAGTHVVSWQGTDAQGAFLSGGVYFAKVENLASAQMLKMVILK